MCLLESSVLRKGKCTKNRVDFPLWILFWCLNIIRTLYINKVNLFKSFETKAWRVCYTFGWPYCIERGCHENFLSYGSSVVRLLAQTLMLKLLFQLCVSSVSLNAKSSLPPLSHSTNILHIFNICMLIYLFTSGLLSEFHDAHATSPLHSHWQHSVAMNATKNAIQKSVHNSHVQFNTYVFRCVGCMSLYRHCLANRLSVGCVCISRWREQTSVCIPIHKCMRYQHTIYNLFFVACAIVVNTASFLSHFGCDIQRIFVCTLFVPLQFAEFLAEICYVWFCCRQAPYSVYVAHLHRIIVVYIQHGFVLYFSLFLSLSSSRRLHNTKLNDNINIESHVLSLQCGSLTIDRNAFAMLT